MQKINFKALFSDIRFWIFLFFIIRLIGITNAPLETGHNWRQSFTNMVARNYYDNGLHFLYPQIDMAGEKTGIVASEFPFFNFLIYLFSKVFGYAHWYGRLINLVVSSVGIFYFFKLIKEVVNSKVAFNATIVLLVSIWFAFSRKSMPDTFSVALVIIGLYYGYKYMKQNNFWSLLLFFIFSTLGMLCKIPALSLFSVLAIVPFVKSIQIQRRLILSFVAFLSVSIVLIWYYYWVPFLLTTYQFQLFFPKRIMEGINEILPYIPEALKKFYFDSTNSYVAFVCCLAGILFFLKSKEIWIKVAIAIISAVFLIFIIKTGAVFPFHSYYIIPFTPVMALIIGYFLVQLPSKYRIVLLFLIIIEAVGNQNHDFFIKESELYRLSLDQITTKNIQKSDLIIINGGQSPQTMYFAHKKGWSVENRDLKRPYFIDSLANLGAKYLVINQTDEKLEFHQFDLKYKDSHFWIYRLK
jgi:hypothetical protein